MKIFFYSIGILITFFILWISIAIYPILTIKKIDQNFPLVDLPSENIDSYLFNNENKIDNIFPNAEKKIYWHENIKNSKTKYSIVFIHGFTTTGYQSKIFLEKIASELESNLFITRLSGHGVPYEGTNQISVDKMMYDVAEAINIGALIGERVLLMGHSLGGALSMLAANDSVLVNKIDKLILFAPGNSGLTSFGIGNAMLSSVVSKTGDLCIVIDCNIRTRLSLPENEQWEDYFTTNFDTKKLYEAITIAFATDDIEYDKVTTPALIFYDKDDKLVNSVRLKFNFKRWATKNKVIEIEADQSDWGQHMFPSVSNSHLDSLFIFEIKDWLGIKND